MHESFDGDELQNVGRDIVTLPTRQCALSEGLDARDDLVGAVQWARFGIRLSRGPVPHTDTGR